tara:strand:+ start:680 stop:1360 length:681 start_codon:yes stop_codon:yes gene_type:complete
MKIFLDTADVKSIADRFSTGLIDGITTNPTLIRKSGRNPDDVYQELVSIGVPDISMEVVADNTDDMFKEAHRLVELFGDESTTIKLPCTPDGLKVCKELSNDGVKVNVTLIFSVSQAILSTKAGARYLSPFVGRVDDQRFGGVNLIKRIREVLHPSWSEFYQYEAEILSASIRSVGDVEHSFAQGADICTMPPAIFDKMYNHILTDVGVDLFNKDYESINANLVAK